MIELREYQSAAIQKMRDEISLGKKRVVFVLPTGGGKSVVFGQIIKNAYERTNKILWIVHRRNLVLQMKETLETYFGIAPGIIMQGFESDLSNPGSDSNSSDI